MCVKFFSVASAILMLSCADYALGDCTQPSYERMKPPGYPPEAVIAGIGGKTVVLTEIGLDGIPTSVSVQSSSGNKALDDTALDAAKQFEFRPSYCAGHPALSKALVPFEFNISENSKGDYDVKVDADDQPMEFSDVWLEKEFLEKRDDLQSFAGRRGVVFRDKLGVKMWIIERGREESSVAVFRVRQEIRDHILFERYTSLCTGSTSWCKEHVEEMVEVTRTIPIPLPMKPAADAR